MRDEGIRMKVYLSLKKKDSILHPSSFILHLFLVLTTSKRYDILMTIDPMLERAK